jgi:hypothetical protein
MRAPDRFGAFLALGLTAMIVVQAFFNISVVLGLLPTKGIPLPFVSFGGSSLLMSMVGMGICSTCRSTPSASQVITSVLEPLPGMTADALDFARAGSPPRRDRRRRHRRPSVSRGSRSRASCSRGSRGRQVSFAGTGEGHRGAGRAAEGFALDLLRSAGVKGRSIAARCARWRCCRWGSWTCGAFSRAGSRIW